MRGNASPGAWARMMKTRTCLQWWRATRSFRSICAGAAMNTAGFACARPGTADYGALTVFVQWHAEPELLFDVPPHCFVPAPKVTSTVVRLRVRKSPPVAVQDEKLLFTVVRAAFNQRRKTLVNALSAGVPGCDKARAAAAVAACGLDARVRGETLSLARFAALSDALGSELGNGAG